MRFGIVLSDTTASHSLGRPSDPLRAPPAGNEGPGSDREQERGIRFLWIHWSAHVFVEVSHAFWDSA